jgi:hypothetical protein
MATENTNNAPIRVDDDPFVGCINQEYRNSADVANKPVLPATGTSRRKYYDDAIADEKAQFQPVQQYGAAPYELDADGKKIEVERMGDKPAQTPPTSGTASVTETETTTPSSPAPQPPSTGG